MTAEIAIMNKNAIALATDSAVTMSGSSNQKIFTSANKLFALSKYHPIGIMIYGNAIFMKVPWETIIKIYRNNLRKKKFNTLNEYANNFIAFLNNGNPLFPNSIQEEYLYTSIHSYFNFIKNKIKKKIEIKHAKDGIITDEIIEQIVSEEIEEHYKNWDKAKNISSIPKTFNENIIKKYKKTTEEIIEKVFEKLPISKNHLNKLQKISRSLFSKFPENIQNEAISGIVIAGFGEKEAFPSLKSFHIEGIVINQLKFKELISVKIDFNRNASIIPFAQSEMVSTFMEGVDPFYKNFEESYITRIFSKYTEMIVDNIKRNIDKKNELKEKLSSISNKIIKAYIKKMEETRREKYISPITSVVSMLPKDELAAMAESLVNLTSFKRKVTLVRETVAGPVDVAVISKGDGFVWIKRKHYFKAELNPQFFANYYKEV